MDWSICKVSPYAISTGQFTNGLNSRLDYNSVIAIAHCVATRFKAVVVAVMPTKSSDCGLNEARAALITSLEKNRLQVPKERLAIHLRHGDNLELSL